MNPEEHEQVPLLSGASPVVDFATSYLFDGIVLDNAQELRETLTYVREKYFSRPKKKSSLLQSAVGKFAKKIERKAPLLAQALAGIESSATSLDDAFVERAIERLEAATSPDQSYSQEFSDVWGPIALERNFVTVSRYGWKYELCIQRFGTQGHDDLHAHIADDLRKPRSLVCGNIDLTLGVVDEWWLAADLHNLLRYTGIPAQSIDDKMTYKFDNSPRKTVRTRDDGTPELVDLRGDEPRLVFMHGGNQFDLEFSISGFFNGPRNEKGECKFTEYHPPGMLVGAAWSYKENVPYIDEKYPSRIGLVVKPRSMLRAVAEDERTSLKQATEYLASAVRRSLDTRDSL